MTISVAGREFRSTWAASKALGISRKTIEYRMKKNLPLEDFRSTSREVIVNGQYFPSIRAAAKALRCGPGTIHRLVKKHGPVVELKRPPKPRAKPITLDGVEYPSRMAAAQALGIPYIKLQRMYQE